MEIVCWNVCFIFISTDTITDSFPFSSEGIGIGVKRAVIASLLQRAITDPNLCKMVNSEGHYSLATRKATINKELQLEFRVFGFVCMLYTFIFLLAPDPVSPALLKYCIGGLQSLINIDFIQSFSPGTANVWPLTPLDLHQSHNWQVTVGNLASEHLEMLVRPHICILFTAFAQFFWQPVQLQGADLQLRQHFTQHIFSGEMLGCPLTLYDLKYT